MPKLENVVAYVKKAYAAQQETLHLLESQMGEWQKHMPGTLASQRAGQEWVETMLGLLRNLVALTEDLGSMRRLLTAMRSRDARVIPKDGPDSL